MARVRRGTKARARRNKILKIAKGFHFSRRKKFRRSCETVKRSLHYTYKSRRIFKRDIRSLWVVRISAAAKLSGTCYSRLMGGLKKANVEINRKMLAEIAATDEAAFAVIANTAK